MLLWFSDKKKGTCINTPKIKLRRHFCASASNLECSWCSLNVYQSTYPNPQPKIFNDYREKDSSIVMFCQKGRNFNYISPELPLYSFYCSYLWTRIKQFHQNCKTTKHTTNCSREILQQDETEILPHTGKLKKKLNFSG